MGKIELVRKGHSMDHSKFIIPDSLSKIIIIQRNNKRSSFHAEKIAIAIKKGFDSIENNYTEEDSHFVFSNVIEQLTDISKTQDTIAIEQIQDTIEKQLLKLGYEDVYESFSSYRLRRSESRNIFMSSQHKFMKAIEKLSVSEKEYENPMSVLIDYGSTISTQYAKSYQIESDYMSMHDDGLTYIHDLEYYPLATTSSILIKLNRLFQEGISPFKPPTDIHDYGSLATIAIELAQNDQHGEVSILDFDTDMSCGVVETYKQRFLQTLEDYQKIAKVSFSKWDAFNKQINKLNSIDIDLSAFEKYVNDETRSILINANEQALIKTKNETAQAMETMVNTLNLVPSRIGAQLPISSLQLGLDTSKEARMVTKQLLRTIRKSKNLEYPKILFQLKHGVNLNFEDPNFDLFDLALQANEVCSNILFVNTDATMNVKQNVGYFANGIRIADDIHQQNSDQLSGRGLLSMTSINMVRLGIRFGTSSRDVEGFYTTLKETVQLVIQQLVDRLEFQSNKPINYFPFLMKQKIMMNSEKLKAKDSLKNSLKHGTLAIELIGLDQCGVAMNLDSNEMMDVINQIIDDSIKKFKLNFVLTNINPHPVAESFRETDQSIFGKLTNVTDVPYSTSDHPAFLGGHLTQAEDIQEAIELDKGLIQIKKD